MLNFNINVDRQTDGQTDGRTNGKVDAFVTKSEGQSERCFMQGLMVA